MIRHRLIERPAFEVIGKKTWIAGPDTVSFGRFWQECRAAGLLAEFEHLSQFRPGTQTQGVMLGISRVEADPDRRDFYYMIAIEKPTGVTPTDRGLETYQVPATLWAVFECHGQLPLSLVESEMYALTQWLPTSGFVHANAPEMEVYPPGNEGDNTYCEFWLPVVKQT